MEQTTMDQTMGTKWFKFYTKGRPWLLCVTAFVAVMDYVSYMDMCGNSWWLLLYAVAAVACPVMGFAAGKRAQGDYKTFVHFVKKVLAFETVQVAYQLGVQNYVEMGFDISSAILTFGFGLLLAYLIWYKLNVKYFEKRVLENPVDKESPYGQWNYQTFTNTMDGDPELLEEKKRGKTPLIVIGILVGTLLLAGLLAEEEEPLPQASSQQGMSEREKDKPKWEPSDSQSAQQTPQNDPKGEILSAEDVYTTLLPSVVEIYGESDTHTSTGTGFFLDDSGTVVTNYHVIEDCQTAQITLWDDTVYQVLAVLGYDAGRDIAILSTDCTSSIPVTIRTSTVKTGETVYAIGSSLGLTGSLSDGLVSAVGREVEGYEYIQTTAPISSGNSGGPLVDQRGQVLGIVCASFIDGQNLNLAIPVADLYDVPQNQYVTLAELFPEGRMEAEGSVEWLSDWFFQYYEEDDSYVLLFQLADIDEIPMTASGTVEIYICNDNGEVVYDNIHWFDPANFEEWIYQETEEMYLASIYISPESILTGSTENGTVYFEVYGEDYAFEECTIEVDCLPAVNP